MKKLILASLLILGANITNAQSTQSRASTQSSVNMNVQIPGPEDRAKVQTDRMAKDLKLTSEQKAKVLNINITSENQLDGIRKAGAGASPERTTRLTQLRNEQLHEVLTAEQYAQYEASHAQRGTPNGAPKSDK